MRRAYIYIDYPRPVDDGGYYYSIDLAHYLKDNPRRKSEIRWGAQQRSGEAAPEENQVRGVGRRAR